jgi:multiple antibiotic resistance protein
MNSNFISSTFLLLLLLDPLGNIPVVLSLLRGQPIRQQQRIVIRESLIAGLLLITFVYLGDWLLGALHLSPPAIEISGGLILFLIALRMVFPLRGHDETDPEYDRDPLIVPLAVPMIAGPSSLATVLINARQAQHSLLLVGSIVVAILINMLILCSAGRLAQLFGKAGLAAMERLMGLALTTLSIQMLISGIRVAFSIPIAS